MYLSTLPIQEVDNRFYIASTAHHICVSIDRFFKNIIYYHFKQHSTHFVYFKSLNHSDTDSLLIHDEFYTTDSIW